VKGFPVFFHFFFQKEIDDGGIRKLSQIGKEKFFRTIISRNNEKEDRSHKKLGTQMVCNIRKEVPGGGGPARAGPEFPKFPPEARVTNRGQNPRGGSGLKRYHRFWKNFTSRPHTSIPRETKKKKRIKEGQIGRGGAGPFNPYQSSSAPHAATERLPPFGWGGRSRTDNKSIMPN